MAKNSNRNKKIKKKNKINKAAGVPNTTSTQRSSKKQISTAAIEAVRHIVEILKPFELSKSQRLRTYQTMLMDDAIFAPIDSRSMAIETAMSKSYFEYDINSEESVAIKEFLEYNLATLDGQTPRSIGRAASEMIINSWSPFEIVYQNGSVEYPDKYHLKKLAYIHPLTLDQSIPFELSPDGNEILKLRQSASAFVGTNGNFNQSRLSWSGVKEIDFRRVAFCSYGASSTQPIGNSPLDAAYTAWREKQLLQDYLLIGVTRDFSGTPVLRIPEAILAAASQDPSSPEAAQVNSLADSMANMHSGDSSYVLLPSDSQAENGSGLRDFDIQFLGVEGGGKGFNITEIIEQKKRAIYNALASQNLITGEQSGGSFNLLEGQSSAQAMFVARDCMIIEEMWNKKVFPQLLELNGWEYEQKDLPKLRAGSIQPLSVEEFSKGVMRCKGLMPVVPSVINQVLSGIGIDYEVDKNMSTEDLRELLPDYEDNTGLSSGQSGTGDSQSGGAGSDNNGENAA